MKKLQKAVGIIGTFILLFVLIGITPLTYAIQHTTSEAYIPSESLNEAVQIQRVSQNKIYEITNLIAIANALPEEEEKQEEPVVHHVESYQYENAAYIWNYLKDLGYNDYVCAGILGNIMAEVGGHTLTIRYWLESGKFYGMCMWNVSYFPGVYGLGLEGQCNYLRDTIEGQINSRSYYSYSQFLNLQDEREAALYFAKAYERCSANSYYQREVNAAYAYKYFIG